LDFVPGVGSKIYLVFFKGALRKAFSMGLIKSVWHISGASFGSLFLQKKSVVMWALAYPVLRMINRKVKVLIVVSPFL